MRTAEHLNGVAIARSSTVGCRMSRSIAASSESMANYAAMVNIYFMHYTLCRIHRTLRVGPAMEAKLTDRIWPNRKFLATR